MKSVAILTLNKLNNYGTQLQMYALMHVIKKLGYECMSLSYISKYQNMEYNQNAIKKFAKNLLTKNGYLKRDNLFDDFRKQYINSSNEIFYFSDDMVKICKKFDKVICGSDQIWNPIFTGMDKTYYLPFVEGDKRIAYAASIGVSELLTDESEFMIPYIKEIPYVSVREKSASELLQKYGCYAQHVLDPTMLINSQEWTKHCKPYELKYKNYILYYDLVMNDSNLYKFAQYISKKLGLKIVNISTKIKDLYKIDAKNLFDIGPLEFLWLIKNASFVITNSYHGMLFSVNFNKPFIISEKSYGKRLISSRVVDFLNLVNLENRIIKDDIFTVPNKLDIDYTEVNKLVERKRKESINWLASALTNNYKNNLLKEKKVCSLEV